ncbi:MAG: hypothetical protein E7638_02435 [Ruminococcaceae bacterium]|nr:hypothetical protein [Oscillospiraceae bacterium]
MKSIVTARDMALFGRIFKYNSPETLPLSFRYNGEVIRGIPSSWNPTVERQLTDACITTFVIRGRNEDGLEVKVEAKEYRDYPMIEYTAFFTNTSDHDTGIVSDIRIAEGVIKGKDPVFIHGNGDTCCDDGYEWWRDALDAPEKRFTITPNDGTSCNGAFPYMRLMFDGFGVNIAVGWTGMWRADAAYDAEGAFVSFGQKRCHFVIRPGEIMRTPRVNLEAFCGDENRGMQMWRRWYFDHILPKENGRPISPKCCMHVFAAEGHPEFTGATEENQCRGIDAYLKGGIRPDIWWIDAGWYPCDYRWQTIGTWKVDKKRFQNGLGAIGKKCHENDMQFLLWFEPERVTEDTELWNEHRDWLLFPDGEGSVLLNLGDPECCDFIINRVDSIIKESGVDIYRQDFNMNPAPCWEAAEDEDRIGAVENLHIQGYLRYWDTLIERNPGLWIDSCASGGRRNDLETMRRAVTLHYTDVGYGHHPIKQKQHRQMFEWIPYFRAHNMDWENPETGEYEKHVNHRADRYAYHCAMAPSLTDMMEWDATEEDYALAREMQPIWRHAAELMLDADYYPLTECRKSREDFYAMYFYNPDEKRGFVQAVRNNACPEETFTAYMTSLEPETAYRFTNPETGEEKIMTGKAAAAGFTMAVERRAGQVWFFEKK